MRQRTHQAAAALAAALSLSGCFTRGEVIEIRPDGSARVTVTMEGDEQDYREGEPLAPPPGWRASRETSVDREGKRQVKATWSADLPGLDRYPVSFAAPGAADAAVTMTTSLAVEEKPDQVIYRFRRVFHGRRSGIFETLREESIPEDLRDRADQPEALSPEEKERLFAAFAEYESAALLLRGRNMLGRGVEQGALEPSAYQPALDDLSSLLEARLSAESLRRFFLLPEERQSAEKERFEREFRDRLERAAGEGGPGREALRAIVEGERRFFEVTQDLTDDGFDLTVSLPGRIVQAGTLEVEGGTARWHLAGEDLVEGDRELIAVSVAPR